VLWSCDARLRGSAEPGRGTALRTTNPLAILLYHGPFLNPVQSPTRQLTPEDRRCAGSDGSFETRHTGREIVAEITPDKSAVCQGTLDIGSLPARLHHIPHGQKAAIV
jgi:hypothetical protein